MRLGLGGDETADSGTLCLAVARKSVVRAAARKQVVSAR